MKRRAFILGTGAYLLPAFPVVRAQEAGRRRRIGILTNSAREGSRGWQAFLDALGHDGFVEGRNLDVDRRGFSAAANSFEAVAIELAQARPDVIVATGPEAARAAQRATSSIAIVATADDMVASGLVTSMSRPNANTTGVSIFALQLDVKRLQLLHEAVPQARRIAVLADRDPAPSFPSLDAAAQGLGTEAVPFGGRSQEEIVQAIDAMKAKSVDAVNVLASPILWDFRSLILDRLRALRLPAVWQWPEGAELGGLIGYGPRNEAVFRQCALQVAKLLRGAKVTDMPVEQPTRIELVINAKAARELDLTIPPSLIARADEVIE